MSIGLNISSVKIANISIIFCTDFCTVFQEITVQHFLRDYCATVLKSVFSTLKAIGYLLKPCPWLSGQRFDRSFACPILKPRINRFGRPGSGDWSDCQATTISRDYGDDLGRSSNPQKCPQPTPRFAPSNFLFITFKKRFIICIAKTKLITAE